MSDSFRVYGEFATEIDVVKWTEDANVCLRRLLAQSSEFSIDLEVFSGNAAVTSIIPGKQVFGFIENNFLNRGAVILYGKVDDWELMGDVPLYEFCISEVSRHDNELMIVLVIALLASAAKFMGSVEIVDYQGIINSRSDKTLIEDLLNLRLDGASTIDAAVKSFYQKLPVR